MQSAQFPLRILILIYWVRSLDLIFQIDELLPQPLYYHFHYSNFVPYRWSLAIVYVVSTFISIPISCTFSFNYLYLFSNNCLSFQKLVHHTHTVLSVYLYIKCMIFCIYFPSLYSLMNQYEFLPSIARGLTYSTLVFMKLCFVFHWNKGQEKIILTEIKWFVSK